ncbi:hypothetical protein OU995_16860 [Roseateles sp. SL47]|nr:hypothetical protein [Roseateles sp. SL47]WAC71256.1 hypothetical protein OU995_16860 [Roseateles sp. SL47]
MRPAVTEPMALSEDALSGVQVLLVDDEEDAREVLDGKERAG